MCNFLLFFSFDILGKEIEFGKPSLYTTTSSEDLIIVSFTNEFLDMRWFYFAILSIVGYML